MSPRALPANQNTGVMKSASSLDDILSSSPNASFSSSAIKAHVLEPKRITAEEIERKKEEERKTSMTLDETDPYTSKQNMFLIGEGEVILQQLIILKLYARSEEFVCKTRHAPIYEN